MLVGLAPVVSAEALARGMRDTRVVHDMAAADRAGVPCIRFRAKGSGGEQARSLTGARRFS